MIAIPDACFGVLPDFPRTRHLPHDPCAARDDLVMSMEDVQEASKSCDILLVDEKLDGSNCGIACIDNEVYVRNRNHILRKGYTGRGTPAKDQFAPIWQFAHELKKDILALQEELNLPSCAFYGEWLWAKHTLGYDRLNKRYLYIFDVWIPTERMFLDPRIWKDKMTNLQQRNLRFTGIAPTVAELPPSALVNGVAANHRFGPSVLRSEDASGPENMRGQREGVYVKGIKGDRVVFRAKAVRREFVDSMDDHWNKKPLRRNS